MRCDDARLLQGTRDVQVRDLGVRERASQQGKVEHSWQPDVVRPVGPPRYEGRVFLARYATSDVTLWCFGHSIASLYLRRCLAHLPGGLLNGFDDVLVARATAVVALQRFPDLLLARVRLLVQETYRGHDHAWCAVPALQGVVLVKRRLHGMPVPVFRQSLHRRDLVPVGLHRKDSARFYRLPL